MNSLMYIAVGAGVLALIYALILANKVKSQDEGTDRMKEIASAIAEGFDANTPIKTSNCPFQSGRCGKRTETGRLCAGGVSGSVIRCDRRKPFA